MTIPFADTTALRSLLKVFLLIAGIGFAHGQLYVYLSTGASAKGIEGHYLQPDTADTNNELASLTGSEPVDSGKSLAEMLGIIHSHLTGMGLLFLATGLIFVLFTPLRGWKQTMIACEPLLALLTTFGGLWLVRYVHPAFSWLVMLSGIFMAITFYLQLWFAWRGLGYIAAQPEAAAQKET